MPTVQSFILVDDPISLITFDLLLHYTSCIFGIYLVVLLITFDLYGVVTLHYYPLSLTSTRLLLPFVPIVVDYPTVVLGRHWPTPFSTSHITALFIPSDPVRFPILPRPAPHFVVHFDLCLLLLLRDLTPRRGDCSRITLLLKLVAHFTTPFIFYIYIYISGLFIHFFCD